MRREILLERCEFDKSTMNTQGNQTYAEHLLPPSRRENVETAPLWAIGRLAGIEKTFYN